MKTARMLRGVALLVGSLVFTACDEGLQVRFAEPFPAQAADLLEFPARHQAVYTADDSTTSVCIGRTAVWRQELRNMTFKRDSLHHVRADTTYAENGQLHYLKLMDDGLVRDSWLATDTLFSLRGADAGKLRRFQGRYYLNERDTDADNWRVQRLEIDGPHLSWQKFGTDTLRLLALDAATIRYRRENGALTSILLTPASGAQTRRVGRYAGLWETRGEYTRRR
ncbi:hypothetical protein [Hymenobacter negativus]|uniref:LPS export ABC transporter periplasmic protein LptC n=1 Tax=Hymenobacter negativus TaxID=2795026 RepID=A0ABS3QGL6_9BACT|nr:hypothetical protein [Hymenobacter negativus]MBO2009939.1 hypothetical protein [Hymenobacter negativus]